MVRWQWAWRIIIYVLVLLYSPKFTDQWLSNLYYNLLQQLPISCTRRVCMDCPKDPFLWALTWLHLGSVWPSFWFPSKQIHLEEKLCGPHFCRRLKVSLYMLVTHHVIIGINFSTTIKSFHTINQLRIITIKVRRSTCLS